MYDRICSTYVRIYVHMYEIRGIVHVLYIYMIYMRYKYIHMYMYIQ